MNIRTWIIVGATSLIAEQFAHLAAQNQKALRLVGRDREHLELIANDIRLRFKIPCGVIICDFTQNTDSLLPLFAPLDGEFDLFIAHSDFTENNELTPQSINTLISINILSTALLINHYFNLKQEEHHLIYLSSVAACRGRVKNSLYGGTKAAIEVYLEGLQQAATATQFITIAKLGFIDTKQTYGKPGVFYAASPQACAQACWNANRKNKRIFYFPKFWFFIMTIIRYLPFSLYKKMGM